MKIIPFTLSQTHDKGYNSANNKDEQLIRSVLNHDDTVLRTVYREYNQKIKKMVYTFRNTVLDPEDIFQEGLTRAVMNIREGKFRGESSFFTYLNGICRNICLKELNRYKMVDIDKKDFVQEDEGIDYNLLNRVLLIRGKLDTNCRDIIDLRFELREVSGNHNGDCKTPGFEEIAEKLGLTADNARQRFKRCLDKLKELVKNDSGLNG